MNELAHDEELGQSEIDHICRGWEKTFWFLKLATVMV
jgi:hypothetical protein